MNRTCPAVCRVLRVGLRLTGRESSDGQSVEAIFNVERERLKRKSIRYGRLS